MPALMEGMVTHPAGGARTLSGKWRLRGGGGSGADDSASFVLTENASGDWSGYFEKDGRRIREEGVAISIRSGVVEGGGRNEFGAFTLNGTLNEATSEVRCIKVYRQARAAPAPAPAAKPMQRAQRAAAAHGRRASRASVEMPPFDSSEFKAYIEAQIKKNTIPQTLGADAPAWRREQSTLLALDGKVVDRAWLASRPGGFDRPMRVPRKEGLGVDVPARTFKVSDVAELVGSAMPLPVMDVGRQAIERGPWTIGKWAAFFSKPPAERKGRLLNVISLEVSGTAMGAQITAPRLVRSLDWVNLAWPKCRAESKDFPKVQKYCLMSVGGCFTDWHIDFGGSSVWYHLVRGMKFFFFAPPTESNLRRYEAWANSDTQAVQFIGDSLEECFVVALKPGNTLFLPSGWLHAVYTPRDSLVFGGNFVHSLSIPTQLRVDQIEVATGVAQREKYPACVATRASTCILSSSHRRRGRYSFVLLLFFCLFIYSFVCLLIVSADAHPPLPPSRTTRVFRVALPARARARAQVLAAPRLRRGAPCAAAA